MCGKESKLRKKRDEKNKPGEVGKIRHVFTLTWAERAPTLA